MGKRFQRSKLYKSPVLFRDVYVDEVLKEFLLKEPVEVDINTLPDLSNINYTFSVNDFSIFLRSYASFGDDYFVSLLNNYCHIDNYVRNMMYLTIKSICDVLTRDGYFHKNRMIDCLTSSSDCPYLTSLITYINNGDRIGGSSELYFKVYESTLKKQIVTLLNWASEKINSVVRYQPRK